MYVDAVVLHITTGDLKLYCTYTMRHVWFSEAYSSEQALCFFRELCEHLILQKRNFSSFRGIQHNYGPLIYLLLHVVCCIHLKVLYSENTAGSLIVEGVSSFLWSDVGNEHWAAAALNTSVCTWFKCQFVPCVLQQILFTIYFQKQNSTIQPK